MSAMEKSLLHRLKLRLDRLTTKSELVEAECATGMQESGLQQHISELKDCIEKLDTESKFYLSTSKSVKEELLTDCMERQIKAEEHITILQRHATTSTFANTKLPKLELPKFDGNQVKWYEFWDKFEANIHNKNLPDSDKFSYLYSCLEGEAAKAVEGLTITNENYHLALTKLKQRFGIEGEVIDAHYKSLSALPQAKSQAAECRKQLDGIETHLRVLKSLGEDVESNHLRVIIREKFPDSVLYQVNLQVGKEPSVTNIREALETVVSAMEKSGAETRELPEIPEERPTGSTTEALHIREHRKSNRKRKVTHDEIERSSRDHAKRSSV